MRYSEKINWSSINKYKLSEDFIRKEEIDSYVLEWKEIVESIMNNKKLKQDLWSLPNDLKSVVWKITNLQKDELIKRNVLKSSSLDDNRIWFWKDSNVYEFQNNSKYVYKEGKEWNENNIEYLKNKYLILKKYLWDIIPKSYFVYWEWVSSHNERWLKNGEYIWLKSITIQKKVNWKDASKMTFQEKLNDDFLIKLEEWHRKYVLLKMFLSNLITQMWLAKKSMDVQLDLWKLSNRDNFSHDEINFVENDLRSPNLMWDWKEVHFIDFWSWEWDETKQLIFDKLMQEDIFKRWESIINWYWYKI